jgi:GxxExxY protein
MTVHGQLGAGFREAVYQEALGLEFSDRGIPFAAEVRIPIRFKDRVLQRHFRADFLCFGEVVVEIKALRDFSNAEMAQVLNYLRAIGKPRGLLLNFGTPRLTYRRFILTTPD